MERFTIYIFFTFVIKNVLHKKEKAFNLIKCNSLNA